MISLLLLYSIINFPLDFKGFSSKEEALKNGLELYPGLLDGLKEFSDKFNISEPRPISCSA